MLHVVNSIEIPVSFLKSYPVYAGVQDALVQWWYGHNAVAFFLTTPYLGLMYYFGDGISQDYKQAFHWFSRAAEQRQVDAQHCLGLMYHLGYGISKDYIHAFAWVNLAVNNGRKDEKMHDLMLKNYTPSQIKEGLKLSRKLHDKIYFQAK